MFRLELLENIFSLLFLSTNDFVQQVHKDTNAGDAPHVEYGPKASADEQKDAQKQQRSSPSAAQHSYLDLGHLLQGCRGFLADVTAMEGFLKLLKEGLEGMCVVGQQEGQEAGRALPREAEVAEGLGCSVTAETFGTRLQCLSKRTAEAQWRLQIISSNQDSGSGETHTASSKVKLPQIWQAAQLRMFTRRLGKSSADVGDELAVHVSQTQQELEPEETEERRETRHGETSFHGETQRRRQHEYIRSDTKPRLSILALGYFQFSWIVDPLIHLSSDGGGSTTACGEVEVCPCGSPHSWLVPAMLAPPESLLMSCIRRGNFMGARQVCGELDKKK